MDSIRLFLRSNSFRISKRKLDLKDQYLRTNSNPGEINNLSLQTHNDQHSSSEKIKSFLSTHPSSTSVLTALPKFYLELDTCSGLSTPSTEHHHPSNILIAASASESISNARSFTNHSSSKHRRTLVLNNQRRRSWIAEQNIHPKTTLSSAMRRTKSSRYPNRIRKHATEKLTRRHSQVNREFNTNIALITLTID